MIKQFLKFSFRRIKRNLVFSIINIVGLSIGLATSFIILIYLSDSFSYDRYHKNHKNIYRVLSKYNNKSFMRPNHSFLIAERIKEEIPDFKEILTTSINSTHKILFPERKELGDLKHFFYVDKNIFDIFSIDLLYGNKETALNDPFSVILSEETAKKYFEGNDPVGLVIPIEYEKKGYNLTITGVLKKICEKKLLSNLDKTSQKQRIIEILPEVGGEKALKTVAGYYKKGNAKIREAAFNALANWNSYSASVVLFDILKSDNSENYHKQAFVGYVKQVSKAPVSDDQKLLLLRKVMQFSAGDDDKKAVIKSIGKIKTFLALIYIDTFLENKAVQQEAAKAALSIALPSDGKDDGLKGKTVYNILDYVTQVLKGAESDYIKESVQTYMNGLYDDDFSPIFNGKDLEGWQGLVENPISRAKMSKKELAQKQKLSDEKMKENWSVRDGAIWFNGKGNNLCTIKDYGDFELILDWRITKKGDSGIYLRGTPQVQIWDTSRVDVGAQVGSGGLYNNQKYERIPIVVADNPIGDWNTLRITMIGERVTVYLNGILVVDNVIMENYWDRKIPIFNKGAIELQAHGSDLGFRNIYVREIITPESKLSDEETKNGFDYLFNGKDLSSWVGNKTDYVIEDGDIVVYPKRGGKGNLYTEKEYSDFNFRFEFQLTPGANNGLGIRAPLEGDAAYVGMELQILDNTASIYSDLQEYQYHGSVYGVIPAKRGFLKPVGEWNSEEVIVKGSNVKVILNGTVIVDGNIDEASKNGTIDKKEHPGLKRKKGHIGFLGHGSILRFRNVRVKEL